MAKREPKYCSYLGLPEDPNSFFVYATPIHRCHRASSPLAIHPDDQEKYCLTANHVTCPRYNDPEAKLAPPTGGRTDEAYARYGWEATLAQDNNRRLSGRVVAIALAAVTLISAVALVFTNQARIRQALQSGWQPPSGQPTLSATVPGGGPLVGPGTPTPTPFSTWTPTPSPEPTATETSTVTSTFTVTPTPTDIPTGTPTPTNTPAPTPTATPPPLFIPRSPVRYEPNCERTAVQGVVYDAYGNLVAGQTLKLWNQFGYESVATTEAAGQGQGEGYYEFYLYPGPYEKAERFTLAVIDQTTGAAISPQLAVEFTPDRCQPGEGGRQVAIVDWVYNP